MPPWTICGVCAHSDVRTYNSRVASSCPYPWGVITTHHVLFMYLGRQHGAKTIRTFPLGPFWRYVFF